VRAKERGARRPRHACACDDVKAKFVRDFVAARDSVMNLDRFHLT
jgi:catalase (peroxidase I)